MNVIYSFFLSNVLIFLIAYISRSQNMILNSNLLDKTNFISFKSWKRYINENITNNVDIDLSFNKDINIYKLSLQVYSLDGKCIDDLKELSTINNINEFHLSAKKYGPDEIIVFIEGIMTLYMYLCPIIQLINESNP